MRNTAHQGAKVTMQIATGPPHTSPASSMWSKVARGASRRGTASAPNICSNSSSGASAAASGFAFSSGMTRAVASAKLAPFACTSHA